MNQGPSDSIGLPASLQRSPTFLPSQNLMETLLHSQTSYRLSCLCLPPHQTVRFSGTGPSLMIPLECSSQASRCFKGLNLTRPRAETAHCPLLPAFLRPHLTKQEHPHPLILPGSISGPLKRSPWHPDLSYGVSKISMSLCILSSCDCIRFHPAFPGLSSSTQV